MVLLSGRAVRTFVLAITIAALGWASLAEATPVTAFGAPVIAVGSAVEAVPDCPAVEGASCFNTSTGSVTFYIPLTTTNAGVFGVTPVTGGTAGTVVDTGGGTELQDALTMFLRFSPVAIPTLSASLAFSFVDLDLTGVNDPASFFESVKFFKADGTELTDWITMAPQSGINPVFTVTGDANAQTIMFPDITGIVTSPFFVELHFRSSYNSFGKNTPESMIAVLTTETATVPEPGTAVLLGLALVALVIGGRRWASRRR